MQRTHKPVVLTRKDLTMILVALELLNEYDVQGKFGTDPEKLIAKLKATYQPKETH